MSDDDFFIGWSPDVAKVDRRFLLAAAGGLTLGGVAAAAGLASRQRGPGNGTWNPGAVKPWTGLVSADPYPLIRTRDIDGTPRTALLMCMTKCGVRPRLEAAATQGPVHISGALLRRGRHLAITVADGPDWIAPVDLLSNIDTSGLTPPAPRSLGAATLTGEILDSKCWFGAMRPGRGKPHKSCASLCIRYGVPPAFFARGADGVERALVMTAPDGGGIVADEAFMALVADPVEAAGEIVLVGDLATFRVDAGAVRRV